MRVMMEKHILSEFSESLKEKELRRNIYGPTILTESMESSDPDEFIIDSFE